MRVLPEFVQPLLTWLTGKPLHDEKPTHHTSTYHVLTALTALAVGWLLCFLWNQYKPANGVLLWLLGCLFLVLGARKLQLMIVHQCAHGTFSPCRRINTVIGTLISTVLIIEPFESYRRGHLRDHHSKSHMTAADPTVRFLIDLVGLRPGMTVKGLWLATLCSLISPFFHLRVLSRRCFSQFRHSRTQAVLNGLWLAVLAFVAYETSISALVFTFLLPLTVAYNISSCLRLCCEHRWPVSPADSVRDRAWYAGLSTGIFLGEPFPAGTAWGKFAWALRMLTVHLFSRLFVLVGDTPCHDYHHRHPTSPDWPNYAFAREADRRKGSVGWPPYTEVWGLFPAISASFRTLSQTTVSGVKEGD
jgi:fatty acid desaturase